MPLGAHYDAFGVTFWGIFNGRPQKWDQYPTCLLPKDTAYLWLLLSLFPSMLQSPNEILALLLLNQQVTKRKIHLVTICLMSQILACQTKTGFLHLLIHLRKCFLLYKYLWKVRVKILKGLKTFRNNYFL